MYVEGENQEYLKNLIILAKNGDKVAFSEIYNDYYTPLFRYILSRVKSKEEAEDLTQTVFIKIWNSLPNWNENHTSPKSFFFKVAHNSIIDYYRRKSTKDIISDEVVNNFLESKHFEDKERERAETREILNQIIKYLSSEQQEIISLIYTNDLTYEEISKIVNKQESTIRKIHSRAIKKLRDLYND